MRKTMAALLLAGFALTGCLEEDPSIKIGAKNFGESRILAEMMATVARENGVKVAGVVDYPSTQAILEALKRGDIDVYPDYNGTGLVMVGQNPTPDGDEATARVERLYEPLGLTWLDRFGFANDYALAMRPERADDLGIASMSDLVSHAGSLSIGIEDDFARRPLDGLEPMSRRYALTFGNIGLVPLDDRATLYDQLLDGEVDVIEVYTTDGQIADFNLTVLEDDLAFFPKYQAAPLARTESLSAHAGLSDALRSLGGTIDGELMRNLNRRVDVEGRSASEVALSALAELGLIESGAVSVDDPLTITASPQIAASGVADAALRAARRAFEGRQILIEPSVAPLDAVRNGDARLALVSAASFFDLSAEPPTPLSDIEAVAALGQSMIHLVTAQNGPRRLGDVETLMVGPQGSATEQIGNILADGLDADFKVTVQDDESVDALVAGVVADLSAAAVILAPEADRTLKLAFADNNLRLLPIEGWNEGANLVRLPFLRQSRIASQTYEGQFAAVETLGAQLVLAGPAPVTGDAVGDQGPAAVATSIAPISDGAVLALSGTDAVLIDPTLPQAAALAPALPEPPAPISPDQDISLLSIAVVAFLIWILWLYARPEYR